MSKLEDAKVPKKLEPVFKKAQEFVRRYFDDLSVDAGKGMIEISGERYLLVRAASMSVDFFKTVKELYKDVGDEEAQGVARSLLFDIAHAIGKTDARNFHRKMELEDPVDKLSAGPIHFAHSGWAFVDISPESKPTQDENCYLIYDHPYSFESDAWHRVGVKSDFPVCVMNAGYSSGWCEESFGVPLVASEILCKAKGDDCCRFIMAHPAHIENRIKRYLKRKPALAKKAKKYEIPGFFKRKQIEDRLAERERELRLIADSSLDMIAVVKKNGTLSYISPAAKDILGYSPEEMVGTDFARYIHKDDAKTCWDKLGETFLHKKVNAFEVRAVHRNGKIIPVEINGQIGEHDGAFVAQASMRDITDRKRAENALAASEKKYRAIFEASPETIVLLDTKGFVIDVNERVQDTLGFSPEEIKGKHLLEMPTLSPESRKRGMKHMRGRLKGKLQFPYELDFVTKDGKRKVGLVGARVLKDKHDRAVADLVMISDITSQKKTETELKRAHDELEDRVKERTAELSEANDMLKMEIGERERAESELRESRQLYQTLAETAEDFIFIINRDMNVQYVNNYGVRILSESHGSVVGKSVNEIFPPETARRFKKNLNQAFASARPISVEAEVAFPNDVLWLHTNLVPIKGSKGEVSAVMGLARNITERKKAEDAVRESEERYRRLFENSPISLWEEDFSLLREHLDVMRKSGVKDFSKYFDSHPDAVRECAAKVRIRDVNRATLDLFGAKDKKQLLDNLGAVLSDESYAVIKEEIIAVAEGKREFEGEGINRDLNGNRKDVDIRWTVAPGYEDTYGRILFSIVDITESKRLENEVREALKVKSEFMATMSHELRSPLNSIIGCADLVLKDQSLTLSERRVNNLKNVLASADKLISIINNILDMARIEAGKVPIKATRFSLKRVITGAVDSFQGMIEEKGLNIVEEVCGDIPQMFTDKEKVGHVISNLVSNAIKFTDAGEVTIKACRQPEEPGCIFIKVEDTGIGIARDKLEKIFEHFKQIDVSPTRRHEGIGLGLAIVRAYVDLLGGRIEVDSEEKMGSTFTVVLPMVIPDDLSFEEVTADEESSNS